MPEIGPSPEFQLPYIRRARLSNGLKVLIVERHEQPRVQVKLVIRSGETAAPSRKSGLPLLTINMLKEGTKSRSAMDLENEWIDLGANLWTEGWMESCSVNLAAETQQLDQSLDLFADVSLNPAFLDKEYLRLKLVRLEEIQARADDRAQLAEDVFPRLLYPPKHPYSRTRYGTRASVQSITREDVQAFYAWTFVPANAALIVAGDVDPDVITAALEARFGKWSPAPIPVAPRVEVGVTPACAGDDLPDR